MEKVITKNAGKDFNFAVTLCDGYKANGTYTVKAVSESEAQEKALTEICDKLCRKQKHDKSRILLGGYKYGKTYKRYYIK